MSLKEYLPMVLGFEGGFVDDPDDPGGRTNKGVTQKTFNDYLRAKKAPGMDVKDITDIQVEEIYNGYWIGCYGDKIENVSPSIAGQVFDFAINAGPITAIKALQRLLGVEADGIYGPKTEAALKADISYRGNTAVSTCYAYERIKYYTALALRRPASRKFLLSWISRTLVASGVKL